MRTNLKNRRYHGGMILSAYRWIVPVLLMGSCFKTNQSIRPAVPAILQYIAQDSSLRLLSTAVTRVQLDTAMSSGGPFTFFAPTDSAFLAAGVTADSINRMDAGQLLLILKYMVVNGRLSSADLPGFLKQQFTSLHPVYKPFINKSYYGIFINGIGVTRGNIEVGDGVVQVVGRVPFPPVGSQLDKMDQSQDMKFFAALVRHVYTLGLLVANPDPNSVYRGDVPYPYSGPLAFGNTLLVPTDSAFIAYGYPDSVSLYNDSLKVVQGYLPSGYQPPILAAYLFNGFDFTSDFKGQFQLGSANLYRLPNANFNYWTSMDGLGLTGSGIAPDNPVRITGPDILATNGVIQKINQVFLVH